MKKRNTLRRVLALLCCMAMLLPCVPFTLAAEAEDVLVDENFESYTADADLGAVWVTGGDAGGVQMSIGTDQAFGGKQSILVEDTQNKAGGFVKVNPTTSAPAGTEFILSAKYYVETLDGSGDPYLNLYAGGNNSISTYSTGKWDTLSVIATTTEDEQGLGVLMGSHSATLSKVYWDDVKLQLLTEELALQYVDEKVFVPGTNGIFMALNSKALGLNGVDQTKALTYGAAIKTSREEKGSALTKAEVQVCVDKVNAGEVETPAIIEDDFETYTSPNSIEAHWSPGGGSIVDRHRLATEQAFSGKQSILMEDTSEKDIYSAYRKNSGVPTGTELILSAKFFVESHSSGTAPYLNLYTNGNHFAYVYSTGQWDSLSVIASTTADSQTIGALVGSNSATLSKTYWDDVEVNVLTEKLAAEYVTEKASIPNVTNAADLMIGLNSKALGLIGVDSASSSDYLKALKALCEEKEEPLTKEEIQTCVDNVNMEKIAAKIEGDVLAVGELGDIPAAVVELVGGISAQWASVSPADKSIALADGKATATAIPTGDNEDYAAILRLSSANKSIDVKYTIRLVNEESFNVEKIKVARTELLANTVIGTGETGVIAAPTVKMEGVSTRWGSIKSDPNNCVSVSNGKLTVKALPSGLEYYEAVVMLRLIKGNAVAEVEYSIIVYDDEYQVLMDLPNASLEEMAKDGEPTDWNTISPASVDSYIEPSDQVARTGDRSVRIVDLDTEAATAGIRVLGNAVPAKKGYEYVGTFWEKGTSYSPTNPRRTGLGTYVEYFDKNASRKGAAQGPSIQANESEWTPVSMWSMVETDCVGIMAYSFVATLCDVYVDDFRIWELTPKGSALSTDDQLTGNGDAETLYSRLQIKSLGVSDLKEANKEAYLRGMTEMRADKGGPLSVEELALAVKEINATTAAENRALLAKLSAEVETNQTITQPGAVQMPDLGDSGVTAKFTQVTGVGAPRIRLTGVGAYVDSLPAYGKQTETAKMVLNLSKGDASVNVNVTVTLKAFTKTMNELAEAAKVLDITDSLNGQAVNSIMSDMKALPAALDGDISVTWQALDAATFKQSNAVTPEGKVNRPAYGESDAAIALRATLTKNNEKYTRDLYLIVAAEGAEDARAVITNNVDFEAKAPESKFAAPEGWLKGLKWEDGTIELLSSYANVVDSTAYSGKQSLRITANGQMASVQNTAETTAREGFVYTLEAMTYTESDVTNPSISVKFWDNEGLEITDPTTTTYASAPGGIGVWKNLSVSAVAPAGAVLMTAELDGGTVEGETYFDDVRLREWPIAANGEFELGTAGWTTEGTVADGKLTLAAGQTAVSMTRFANRGVTYYLSLEADGGKAALRFVDQEGKTLAEYAKDMKSGLNAFFAYAPADTAGVQVVLTGAMTADNVKITRSATGTGVTDGDFENSATAGAGTPWELTNAEIAPNTGKTGAGLTVKNGGKATSTVFPVEDGKGYAFSADVKGKGGQMEIVLYNAAKKTMNKITVTSESDSWNTISYNFDQLIEAIDTHVPEHSYAQIVLSGEAVFDNVKVNSVSKNVSNASMENTKIMPYGTFPYNWAGYGSAATYMANQDGQYTEGVKGLAVELFGLGEGGVRSSMLENIKGGKAYEATVNAKGSGAKLFIEFWDKDFNKLGSEFVTIDSADFKEYSVKATAPSGTIYASLSVGGDGVGLVCADEAAIVPVVRSIGTNVQLFLDNWLIADSENVQRTFYQGEKQDFRSTVFTYPSVHWDEKEQIYKMWHLSGGTMRYRTSEDGINWGEAIVCYFDNGSTVTGSMVHIDDDEPDPSKRYKSIIWNNQQNRTEGSYDYYSSADGITWKFEAKGIRGQDVITMAYDEVNDEYIVTYKISMTNPNSAQNKRTHSIAISKDLINWTEAVRQYSVGTPADTVEQNAIRSDGYGNGMYALGDSYVSLNWRFLLQDQDSFVGQLDSNLLFSRDLTEDWQRLRDENGNAVLAIPRGPEGQEDDAQIYTAASAIQMGDETWWWWYGLSGDHSGTTEFPRTGFSSAVKWRRNGFASMDFTGNGTMTTEQFTLMGDKLHLNAKGNLTVELLDATGAVAATGKFSGDSVDSVLTWDKSLADQLGKVVSLRFTSSDAKLYTIQWEGSIFSDVATDAWYHNAVHYAVDNGIMGGYGGGKFGPDDTLSRAMVVQMLYNKVGQPAISGKHAFNDVPADQWFNNAVTWGTQNGVMGGYGDGKFGPNDSVTIEQIAVILWNYSGNPEFNAELGNVGKFSGWAENGLTWARDNGILHGVHFENATDNATRAQAAQMLTNYLRR